MRQEGEEPGGFLRAVPPAAHHGSSRGSERLPARAWSREQARSPLLHIGMLKGRVPQPSIPRDPACAVGKGQGFPRIEGTPGTLHLWGRESRSGYPGVFGDGAGRFPRGNGTSGLLWDSRALPALGSSLGSTRLSVLLEKSPYKGKMGICELRQSAPMGALSGQQHTQPGALGLCPPGRLASTLHTQCKWN